MNAHEILSRNIRRRRAARGWSQADLADAINVARTRISEFERCLVSPTLRTIELLAEAFGVKPHTLLRP